MNKMIRVLMIVAVLMITVACGRESVASRNFTNRKIGFESVTKILWATHGVTYTGGDQTVHGLDAVSSATEVPRYSINPASYNRYIKVYYISEEGYFDRTSLGQGLGLKDGEEQVILLSFGYLK